MLKSGSTWFALGDTGFINLPGGVLIKYCGPAAAMTYVPGVHALLDGDEIKWLPAPTEETEGVHERLRNIINEKQALLSDNRRLTERLHNLKDELAAVKAEHAKNSLAIVNPPDDGALSLADDKRGRLAVWWDKLT